MAGPRTYSVWLPSRPARDYTATTGTDAAHLMNTILLRGAVVGGVLALAWIIGKSMVDDLMEEVAAGLT